MVSWPFAIPAIIAAGLSLPREWFVEKCSRKQEVCLLILGIDNAGKTTILEQSKGIYRKKAGMALDKIPPTVGLNVGHLEISGCKTLVWDVGGHSGMRSIWTKYYNEAHGIMFVVDSTDGDRFVDCSETFRAVLNHPETKGLPVLIFANKQDLGEAAAAQAVLDALKIKSLLTERTFKIQPCSGLTCEGLKQGMDWLVQEASQTERAIHQSHES